MVGDRVGADVGNKVGVNEGIEVGDREGGGILVETVPDEEITRDTF